MDVLLVQPGKQLPLGEPSGDLGIALPMALLYLAKSLLEKGFDVQILDRSAKNINGEQFKHYIEINRPAVVGITALTVTFNKALKAAGYIKNVDSRIKVVMGGPHVTFTAADTLKNPHVDVVVRGEGDINFPLLVEHFINDTNSLEDIPGISYRQGGKINETPGRLITAIDSLSFPPRDLVDFSRYLRPGSIFTSRGCPFNCRFCTAQAMAGGRYRMRSNGNIMKEIDYLVNELNIPYLDFLDDTLTASPKRAAALCRHIIEKGYRFRWSCESRVDAIDKELLTLMARAGCDTIQMGFESGSQTILNAIGKRITLKQVENSAKFCLEAGIRPLSNFIIGFPEDTMETVRETIQFARKMFQMGVYIGFGTLTPFPGTYYYNHAEELGLTIHTSNWDDYQIGIPIISTRHFTCDQIREILFDTVLESRLYKLEPYFPYISHVPYGPYF